MATLRKTIDINAPADAVWEKVADTGAIAKLIGFLKTSHQTQDQRVCELEDGGTLKEKIISVDHDLKHVTYSITESPLNMDIHMATMDVEERGSGTRLTWTVDLLPAGAAQHMGPMLDGACEDLKVTLAQ